MCTGQYLAQNDEITLFINYVRSQSQKDPWADGCLYIVKWYLPKCRKIDLK